MSNEKLGAPRAPFFMAKPAMKQIEKDGLLLWEVSHGGMVRQFREDWRARWHYEQCIRLYRSRLNGKSG
tara:strand:- start:227 stop:433 length:207 start_codon:yes stop_codon:yes gene_type:complete